MTPPVLDAAAGSSSSSSSPSKSALPSREALASEDVPVHLNKEEICRLYWSLDGPLSTAISVMANPYYDPSEPESARMPYYARATPDGSDAPAAALHPISKATAFHPPVSSADVSVDELLEWDEWWMTIHEHHSSPDSSQNWGPAPVYAGATPAESDEPDLLRCCGEERPWDKDEVRLTVRASREFVTIHDFVSQVHPWLMGMHDELVQAVICTHLGEGATLPPDRRLMVNPYPFCVSVMPDDEWAERCDKKYIAPST